MVNFIKVCIIISCIVFFAGINGFAQQDQTQEAGIEFQKMDKDLNGLVTPEEMQRYQEQKFIELDQDKNGYLDSEELTADKTKMYQPADKDMDNKVTMQESDSQFKEYFQQIDKDNNGQISEAEYTDYWKLIHRF
ncbi:MAG: EF-hand domain-containing protein [Candidatus Omnitrophica bacterium]|nr:EF-hand domain-containing protein [Candidatus Omnitrophota bacterium]